MIEFQTFFNIKIINNEKLRKRKKNYDVKSLVKYQALYQ